MWMPLPTKDCKCATCEKLREVVDENGTLKIQEHFVPKPGDTTGELQQFENLEAVAKAGQESAQRLLRAMAAPGFHPDGSVCDC